ncbi:hypothetical protein LRY65_03485 [Candidatus Woesebacteria bacterium]|nr:hypothetical protein [Candidatus Woesebacteria bacterium]MCD8506957.1 hypothetical protein [Candidatus Woesebacteria bacterium]MCD8527247.1 hypothetical protein [Candidatus Woesebacteria bacterium]MCD8546615.1 hypothetical protein [Candidatus Woesebacteria bacterium]
MTTAEIYDRFQIPRNLRRHMYRVAAVGDAIVRGAEFPEELNHDAIVATLLLHDLGNILKFDWKQAEHLFDPDERDMEHWKDVQRQIRSAYGPAVHGATLAMAQEIGASSMVLDLLKNMGNSQLLNSANGENWNLKICLYCDARVTPHGFTTISERIADILERYQTRFTPEKVAEMKAVEQALLDMEQQFNDRYALSLPELSEPALQQRMETLSDFSHFA